MSAPQETSTKFSKGTAFNLPAGSSYYTDCYKANPKKTTQARTVYTYDNIIFTANGKTVRYCLKSNPTSINDVAGYCDYSHLAAALSSTTPSTPAQPSNPSTPTPATPKPADYPLNKPPIFQVSRFVGNQGGYDYKKDNKCRIGTNLEILVALPAPYNVNASTYIDYVEMHIDIYRQGTTSACVSYVKNIQVSDLGNQRYTLGYGYNKAYVWQSGDIVRIRGRAHRKDDKFTDFSPIGRGADKYYTELEVVYDSPVGNGVVEGTTNSYVYTQEEHKFHSKIKLNYDCMKHGSYKDNNFWVKVITTITYANDTKATYTSQAIDCRANSGKTVDTSNSTVTFGTLTVTDPDKEPNATPTNAWKIDYYFNKDSLPYPERGNWIKIQTTFEVFDDFLGRHVENRTSVPNWGYPTNTQFTHTLNYADPQFSYDFSHSQYTLGGTNGQKLDKSVTFDFSTNFYMCDIKIFAKVTDIEKTPTVSSDWFQVIDQSFTKGHYTTRTVTIDLLNVIKSMFDSKGISTVRNIINTSRKMKWQFYVYLKDQNGTNHNYNITSESEYAYTRTNLICDEVWALDNNKARVETLGSDNTTLKVNKYFTLRFPYDSSLQSAPTYVSMGTIESCIEETVGGVKYSLVTINISGIANNTRFDNTGNTDNRILLKWSNGYYNKALYVQNIPYKYNNVSRNVTLHKIPLLNADFAVSITSGSQNFSPFTVEGGTCSFSTKNPFNNLSMEQGKQEYCIADGQVRFYARYTSNTKKVGYTCLSTDAKTGPNSPTISISGEKINLTGVPYANNHYYTAAESTGNAIMCFEGNSEHSTVYDAMCDDTSNRFLGVKNVYVYLSIKDKFGNSFYSSDAKKYIMKPNFSAKSWVSIDGIDIANPDTMSGEIRNGQRGYRNDSNRFLDEYSEQELNIREKERITFRCTLYSYNSLSHRITIDSITASADSTPVYGEWMTHSSKTLTPTSGQPKNNRPLMTNFIYTVTFNREIKDPRINTTYSKVRFSPNVSYSPSSNSTLTWNAKDSTSKAIVEAVINGIQQTTPEVRSDSIILEIDNSDNEQKLKWKNIIYKQNCETENDSINFEQSMAVKEVVGAGEEESFISETNVIDQYNDAIRAGAKQGYFKLKTTPATWDVKKVNVKVITKTTRYGIVVTKTAYSNACIIYNSTPTVSYRKNKIGINTNNIDAVDNENYILMINQSRDDKTGKPRHKILLTGANTYNTQDGSGATFKAELDLANMELTITRDDSQIARFLLYDIDCGTY